MLRANREILFQIGEVVLIFVWAIYVGRAYLNFIPFIWPTGREFASSIQTHFIWNLLPQCGACVFWNGFVHGGAPAFADLHGSMLHPLVILSTLLWGVLSGAKITLVLSLFIAGFAQWWLTRVMGLGRIARLFCGGMAVVGGHLAGRMELGSFGMVLSTAACSLVIAPAVDLALTGKRRYTILLALAVSSALLSGQGYMQVGLAFSILPAFLLFFWDEHLKLRPIWKEFLLAAILALLLAGILLVPMAHFYPSMYKDTDPAFSTAQSPAYIPLNEVIDNVPFYLSDSLKSVPYPHLYVNYLGWVPVLLAIISLRFWPHSRNRLLAFFFVSLGLVYLCAGATTLKALENILPDFAAGVRHPTQIAGLVNPLILGMAAWGLDGLVKLKWPRIGFISTNQNSNPPDTGISLALLVLTVPLAWPLISAYDFGQNWLVTAPSSPDLYQVTKALQTNSSQWVNLPYGEHFWMIPALESGLKIGIGIRTWQWKEHGPPPVYREGTRDNIDPGSPNYLQTVFGINIVAHPENEYAYVQVGELAEPCQAHALGGNIDVDCPVTGPGQLVVHEYCYSGWTAWRDGARTPLLSSQWLSVDAPAGPHKYSFRYRPWDVWVGILFSLAGLAACVVLWRKARTR